MKNQFGTLKTSTASLALATTPVVTTMIQNVVSIVFDGDLIAKTNGDTASSRAWLVQVVDIALAAPTRRSFVLELRSALQAVQGVASVRLTAAGHTTSREVTARDSIRTLDSNLRLRLRRSTKPRTHLRVLVEVEAQSLLATGEAMATADALSVQAV